MTLGDVSNIMYFIGGLGMFLYGMKLLSGGLQKAAGEKMRTLLGKVTNKRIMGIIAGALVTAIIQSSGATTVMVVGFVNAGILNLMQAVGVIMGANIGTTVTAWIVSLDSLGSAATALKPSFYAPLMIGIGAAFVMFCKKHKKQTLGEILLAVGLLFLGLTTMSGGMEPYMKSQSVQDAFLTLGKNPLLGILIGMVVTGIMQSSSASVGVLQTLAGYGVVPAGTAVFICLGADIGSCFTALLSCAGASKNAKRAAMINLLFNVFGVIVWGTLIFIFFRIFPAAQAYIMSSVTIAIFHSGFKLFNTTLFYPLAGRLVKLSELIIRDDRTEKNEEKPAADNVMVVDDRMLNTPSLAIQVVSDYVVQLGKICSDNLKNSIKAALYGKYELTDGVFANEKQIDNYVARLSDFLVKISNDGLTDRQSSQVKNLMYTVIDLERIGDHAENIAELAQKLKAHNISFSDAGRKDLEPMVAAVEGSLDCAIAAREQGSLDMARNTFRYEDDVDSYEEENREKHIDRLSRNECSSEAGVIFLNMLTNLERVSDHAVNIAGYVKDEA
ncbi:MAG: Na/Pi cotransporter family protein [Butyrivibrio sp.]